MARLNISNRRERLLVGAADWLLAPARLARRRSMLVRPARVLCFRIERVGDLLMTLPALADLRAALPDAQIDLVVGSWNRELAAAIPGVGRVEILEAAWLARGSSGESLAALLRRAIRWRSRRYDLIVNFEPDIRTNLVAAAAGGARRAGFAGGGGASMLDIVVDYNPSAHTTDNARRLVAAAVGHVEAASMPGLVLPAEAHERARRLLPGSGPVVAIHVSGGRPIKQWPEDRFRDVAAWLIRERGAHVVFTGAPEDRAQVGRAKAGLEPARVADATGIDLLTAAALLQRVDLLVTGDTGPMHLAHAVGTAVVAVFGPSDPARYAPRGPSDQIVRIDLPCSPCNRIRQPPHRCVGHTPDCLAGIGTASVTAAVDAALRASRPPGGRAA
jgi:heptosyltransferase-2/heptosyltransferase-3